EHPPLLHGRRAREPARRGRRQLLRQHPPRRPRVRRHPDGLPGLGRGVRHGRQPPRRLPDVRCRRRAAQRRDRRRGRGARHAGPEHGPVLGAAPPRQSRGHPGL
ncbi:MAG: hypothetical protein AVDCRST_MAG32-2777, partial [uncultured Nocardioides sp.]